MCNKHCGCGAGRACATVAQAAGHGGAFVADEHHSHHTLARDDKESVGPEVEAPVPTRCPTEWSEDGSLCGVVDMGYRDDNRSWKGLPEELDVVILDDASAAELARASVDEAGSAAPFLSTWATGSLAFCEVLVGNAVGPAVALEVTGTTVLLHTGSAHKVVRRTSDLLVFEWYSERWVDWPGCVNSAREIFSEFLDMVVCGDITVGYAGDDCMVEHDCDVPLYDDPGPGGLAFGQVGRFESEMYWCWKSRHHVGSYGPVSLVQKAIVVPRGGRAAVQLDSCHPCTYDFRLLRAACVEREAEWGVCRVDVPGMETPLLVYEADLGFEADPRIYVWRDRVAARAADGSPPYLLIGVDYGTGIVNSRLGAVDIAGPWDIHRCRVEVLEVIVPGRDAVVAAANAMVGINGPDWITDVAARSGLTTTACIMALSDKKHFPGVRVGTACTLDLYRSRPVTQDDPCPPLDASHLLGTLLYTGADGVVRDRLLSRPVCVMDHHMRWAESGTDYCARSDVVGALGNVAGALGVFGLSRYTTPIPLHEIEVRFEEPGSHIDVSEQVAKENVTFNLRSYGPCAQLTLPESPAVRAKGWRALVGYDYDGYVVQSSEFQTQNVFYISDNTRGTLGYLIH